MIIVIDNLDFDYHFEIIESIIQRYDIIIKIKKKKRISIIFRKYYFNRIY